MDITLTDATMTIAFTPGELPLVQRSLADNPNRFAHLLAAHLQAVQQEADIADRKELLEAIEASTPEQRTMMKDSLVSEVVGVKKKG